MTGEVTLRAQADLYGSENGAGCPPGTLYGNCTLLDYQTINTAGGIAKAGVNAFLNVTQDRQRMRFRARFGYQPQFNSTQGYEGARLAIAAVRDAGYGDAEIAEVVAHVALNVFTNYFNNVAGTAIDFPRAAALST